MADTTASTAKTNDKAVHPRADFNQPALDAGIALREKYLAQREALRCR